jgi:hypothetical protein
MSYFTFAFGTENVAFIDKIKMQKAPATFELHSSQRHTYMGILFLAVADEQKLTTVAKTIRN